MNHRLEDLGQMIREQSEDARRSQEVVASAKDRFIESARSRQATAGTGFLSSTRLAMGALAVVTALAATWGVVEWRADEKQPLAVTLEEAPVELVGRWVRSGEETKQLSFSDGTKLSLHPDTDLRVFETTTSGATIDLGRGRALAQIEPKKGATWDFRAGPFMVHVTGTEFDLAWDPESQILELALHHGSVILTGPQVQGQRRVQKGEFVRVALGEKERAPIEPAPFDADEPEEDSSVDDGGQEEASDVRDRSARGWRQELQEGEPRDAVRAIAEAGPGGVLDSASAPELWKIARVARLGGRPQLARDALLALRNKHGTRGQTSYLLGKVHADQLGATSEAITWFETYLKEDPNGSLAEQAMGRVAELQGGTRAGKRAARRYLDRYPNGSYADYCRSQLR